MNAHGNIMYQKTWVFIRIVLHFLDKMHIDLRLRQQTTCSFQKLHVFFDSVHVVFRINTRLRQTCHKLFALYMKTHVCLHGGKKWFSKACVRDAWEMHERCVRDAWEIEVLMLPLHFQVFKKNWRSLWKQQWTQVQISYTKKHMHIYQKIHVFSWQNAYWCAVATTNYMYFSKNYMCFLNQYM